MLCKNILSKVVVSLALAAFSLLSVPVNASPIVDLKVLVISTGSPENDLGLDLIDDMLDEIGVPYDVLDASQEELTQAHLVADGKGKYNGIILTEASLYYLGEGNHLGSAFTLEEWQLLHQYERDFAVRESVMSGYPVSGAYYQVNFDLDYGMDLNTAEGRTSFTAQWQMPTTNKEVFEYVNRTVPFNVTDYGIMVSPANIAGGPVVTPLLNDTATGKTLISSIKYPDGREVMLSTISNAWYLIHSQVLSYEFLNFATQGVFIGSRKVYLSSHIDDIFIPDEIWNPETNTTTGDITYRNTAQDITNIVAANNKFVLDNPTVENYKLDFVFNGEGAEFVAVEPIELTAVQDTYLSSANKNTTFGDDTTALVRTSSSKERAVIYFDVPHDITNMASNAMLTLYTEGATSGKRDPKGVVCLVTEGWDETATWSKRSTMMNYSWSKAGGSFDSRGCVPYKAENGMVTVDVASLFNKWQSGSATNFGVLLRARKGDYNQIQIRTRETGNTAEQPRLNVTFQTQWEALTGAVVTNKDEFRFINHTLSHRDMYFSSGATYEVAYQEINDNLSVWQQLALPGFDPGSKTLVTGNHSGLEDTVSSEGDFPLTPYPEGLNLELIQAVEALDIEYMASDASRVNQNFEQYVPNSNVMLLPRYPTAVFYNVTNPLELTDEYNYIFYERYINNNEDPCSIPGAICQPRSYQQILAAEAETTLRHMLTYRPWPHYFHASNLRDYGGGSTLQYDWLSAVVKEYNSVLNLPIVNLDYYSIGVMSKEKLHAKSANVTGSWNRDTNTVTLTSDAPATVRVTGLLSDDNYGGQYILKTDVNANAQVFTVDRALD